MFISTLNPIPSSSTYIVAGITSVASDNPVAEALAVKDKVYNTPVPGVPPIACKSIKPVGKGTGLGLSVSYGIIQQYNGDIKCESKVGEGTTFIVNFPYDQSEHNKIS